MLRSRTFCLMASAFAFLLVATVCGWSPERWLPQVFDEAVTATSTSEPTSSPDAESTTVTRQRFTVRSLGFMAFGMAVTLLIGASNRRIRTGTLLASAMTMLGLAGGGVFTIVQDGFPGWELAVVIGVTAILGLWSFWNLILGERAIDAGEERREKKKKKRKREEGEEEEEEEEA